MGWSNVVFTRKERGHRSLERDTHLVAPSNHAPEVGSYHVWTMANNMPLCLHRIMLGEKLGVDHESGFRPSSHTVIAHGS